MSPAKYLNTLCWSKKGEKNKSEHHTDYSCLGNTSLYFAYNLLQEKKYTNKVKQFVQQQFSDKGYTVVYEKLLTKPKRLELAFLAKKFSDQEIAALKKSMESFGIAHTDLIIRQDSLDLKTTILSEIDKRSAAVNDKDLTIRALNNELAKYQVASPQLDKDLAVLFPELQSYSIGQQQYYAKKRIVERMSLPLFIRQKILWLKYNN